MLVLGNLGGVILPELFTRFIVHPSFIHTIHCSSQLFIENTIHSNTIIKNTDILHNIQIVHTGNIHCLYQYQISSYFLSSLP